MSIPNYETFMLPALQLTADGHPVRRAHLTNAVADALALSANDRALMLPSGKAPVYRSRAGWALTYLKQAGLVNTPARGVYEISERGREVLARSPSKIDNALLSEFVEFRAFRERSGVETVSAIAVSGDDSSQEESPEEALERSYQILRASLVSQLVETLRGVSPERFENIVIDVLAAMGYGGGREGAARAVGRSGDGGIDGVIEEDRLGLDSIYVQAKRWEANVGRPHVQAFAGALQGHRAHKGVMITTSDFTAEAKAYAATLPTRIVLIDGLRLAEMLIDHNVGVSAEVTYIVKQIDSDYFEER
jgi:restriction system protein